MRIDAERARKGRMLHEGRRRQVRRETRRGGLDLMKG